MARIRNRFAMQIATLGQVGLPLLVSVLLLLFVDGIVFRTDIYEQFLSPRSYAGRVYLLAKHLAGGTEDASTTILVVGDSRIAEGFSSREATAEVASESVRFESGAVPGSTPRVWYYLLREIDPEANRFMAVVLPCFAYDDAEIAENYSNRQLDIRLLGPLLRLSDLVEFSSSFDSWDRREDAFLSNLLKGYGYKADLHDFLGDPRSRLELLATAERTWASSRDNYSGKSETLAGLHFDAESKEFVFPEGVPDAVQRRVKLESLPKPVRAGNALARYHRRWYGKIAEYYEGSPTRLLVVRPPRGPWTEMLPKTTQGMGAVRQLQQANLLTILAEDAFIELERPQLFADALHLNREGRTIFTSRLAREVMSALNSIPNQPVEGSR